MAEHVVVGAGPVGTAVARLLAERGEQVLLLSRSGTGPELAGVRRGRVDASSAEALTELARGAVSLHNCVNPPSYDVWPTWWPPVAEAFLVAAERTGAVLATAGCLYPYGEVGPAGGVLHEGLPDAATGTKGALRAAMWAEARARHEAGRLQAVEVRGSDYLGPGVSNSHIGAVAPRALAGRSVRLFGRVDVPHTMTDVRDMARTLVAVAERPEAWGRVWHAPSNPARTQAETVADVCRAAGREPVRVRTWPAAMLSVGGLAVPFLREMRETVHQFAEPWVMDSTAAQTELGLAPTPWHEVCLATARHALAPAAGDQAAATSSPPRTSAA